MSIPLRSLYAAAGVAAAVLLGGCSRTTQATGEPVAAERTDVDPCSLLSPSQVRDVTGWRVPEGVDESELLDGEELAVCSFTEANHLGLVQVQVDEGAGAPAFERRRSELEAQGMDRSDTSVPGAEQAYEAPTHGVVGMLVGDTFVQVVAIGPGVDADHHRRLAELVAEHLS